MSGAIQDSDIDGLLDQLDGTSRGDAGSSSSDNKKKERKKKKDRSNDVDSGMQNLGYSASQASSYQAGSYGAAPNAAPNPFAGNGVGENAPFAQGNLQSGPQSREFEWCGAENQDLVMNGVLLLAFCGFEAVFGMMSGSQVLLMDFFRRLGGVFAMVYTLEMTQVQKETANVHGRIVPRAATAQIHACSDPTDQRVMMDQAALGLRNTERRRLLIASILIATYLLTCAFVMAMGAIISMYGGAPKAVGSSGYIAVTGLLCLALDLVHLKYGVEVHLGNDVDENSSAVWTMFTACFGSCFVVVEGFLLMMTGLGGFTDPFLCLVFAGVIAAGSSEVVQRVATSLQYQTWQERV